MTMGEYIKKLRTGGNKYGVAWTQEELGRKLNPPVNRAAINKWERGLVANIKRSYIEQMSDLFGVTPSELMCFEFDIDEEQVSAEVKTIEMVQDVFGKDAVQLLQYFSELNEIGKQKVLNDICDLTQLPKYSKPE